MHNPFDPGYYSSLELRQMGFARVGENSAISRNCTIIGLASIIIGDNVRIDGFTSIIAPNGRVKIGSHVHIGIGCVIGARGGVEVGDFTSLSQGVRIFSAIDDFGGRHMTGSALPDEVLGVQVAPVLLGRYVAIGSGTLVLPGVRIGEGASVGAMSMVDKSLDEWTLYGGSPVRKLGPRSQHLLTLEKQLRDRPVPL